jgi:hypothetical protein
VNIWLFAAGWAVLTVSAAILKLAFLGPLIAGLQRLFSGIVLGWGLRKTGLDRPGVHRVTGLFGYNTAKQAVSAEDMQDLLPSKRGKMVGFFGFVGVVAGFAMAVAGVLGY